MMLMRSQYQRNTQGRKTVLSMWPGTGEGLRGLDSVGEVLVLTSMPSTTRGGGQWHRLWPQGYCRHGEERHGTQMGRILFPNAQHPDL